MQEDVKLSLISTEQLKSAIHEEIEPLKKLVNAIKETTLSKKEVAKELRISLRTVDYWEQTGKIKRINEVGEPRYRYGEILEIKSGQKV